MCALCGNLIDVGNLLIKFRLHQGDTTWRNVKFNEKPFELISSYDWSRRLPENGILELVFVAAEAPPSGVDPIEDADFKNMEREFSNERATDIWRLNLLHVITGTFYFTAAQVWGWMRIV